LGKEEEDDYIVLITGFNQRTVMEKAIRAKIKNKKE